MTESADSSAKNSTCRSGFSGLGKRLGNDDSWTKNAIFDVLNTKDARKTFRDDKITFLNNKYTDLGPKMTILNTFSKLFINTSRTHENARIWVDFDDKNV